MSGRKNRWRVESSGQTFVIHTLAPHLLPLEGLIEQEEGPLRRITCLRCNSASFDEDAINRHFCPQCAWSHLHQAELGETFPSMNIDTNFRYVRVEELETIQAAIERALPLVLAASNEGDMEQIDEANALLVDLKTASSFVSEMLKRPE